MDNFFSTNPLTPLRENTMSVVHTSDWMLLNGEANAEIVRYAETSLSIAAILSSALERQTELEAPFASDYAALEPGIRELPPQLAFVADNSALGQWLNVATLAEHDGAPRLAQLIVDALMRLLQARPRQNPTTPQQIDIDEAIGICWARRGRLARIRGELDDAATCYLEARQMVRKLPRRDARSMADIGLSLVAIGRGNFPEAASRAQLLLRQRDKAADIFQVHAHQILALTKRRSGHLIEAMNHAWQAFDFASGNDSRRLEIVGSMSDIAIELGDLEAAVHGFNIVLQADVRPRVQVPSLAGALRACARREEFASSMANKKAIGEYSQSLKKLVDDGLAPGDEVLATLAIAEGDLVFGEFESGKAWMNRAAAIATEFGFYEKQFAVENLAQRFKVADARLLQSLATPQHVSIAVPAILTGKNRPNALRRLAEVTF